MEQWKDIKEFEGYQISSIGRVRSNKYGEWRILMQAQMRNGYMYVSICGKTRRTHKYIHRLIAEAFLPNPHNKPQVDHIDRDKTNNRIENLRWVSIAEQNSNRDISTCGSGFKRVYCYETDTEYKNIRECARILNCPHQNVQDAISGKRKSVHGYHFKLAV